MDENYLDNLLNEFSLDEEIDNNIEDELDDQMSTEKRKRQEANTPSQEDVFDSGLERDVNSSDDLLDFDFSEEQMNELDQLDDFADLDIGDVDFSDIDFDDVDITKLGDVQNDDFDNILKDFDSNLEVDSFFDSGTKKDTNTQIEADETLAHEAADISQDEEVLEEDASLETNDNLNEDTFNTNEFLDSLLGESEQDETDGEPIVELPEEPAQEEPRQEEPLKEQEELSQEDLESLLGEMNEEAQAAANLKNGADSGLSQQTMDHSEPGDGEEDTLEPDELDDLLSMLDMEEQTGVLSQKAPEQDKEMVQDIFVQDDIEEAQEESPVKKKRTFMQILFGDPDEDDELSEEELAAIEAKKAEKKAKKEAAKAEKEQKKEEAKEQKALDNNEKQKEIEEKKRVKAEKKAKRKAEALAEAASEKPLNRPMVFFVFTIFLGGIFVFFVFTTDFNYKQAVEKATDYFASQKYHKAYDEIKGVDIKEKDRELKDRIYTVMYVERLYEAYETNLTMGREEKALDSLLRGVEKYYAHYEEAQDLGIVSDIDFSFAQIQNALLARYGISVEQAVALNRLENWEYVQQISSYAAMAAPIPQESSQDTSKAQNLNIPVYADLSERSANR